ncbi:MAG: pyrimidine dimer DNA glycosylase/endonuclease V [Acidithiobacillus ferrivorans]
MRLWSLHPKYLDPQGLVALWREALLAQAVLRNETSGYRNHPQLERFKIHPCPRCAISLYLKGVHTEAETRGYSFDQSKIMPALYSVRLRVTAGQMAYEWAHLMSKLKTRNCKLYEKWQGTEAPIPHPLFEVCPGEVEAWERQ